MVEIWKDVNEYEGIYQISNFGRLKRFYKNKINLEGCELCQEFPEKNILLL